MVSVSHAFFQKNWENNFQEKNLKEYKQTKLYGKLYQIGLPTPVLTGSLE